MILTTRRQHRILSAMYSSLRRSDPRMVATFLMFTRLTSDEAIPPVERIKAGPRRWFRNLTRHAALRWRRATSGPGPGLRRAVGCLLFWPAAAAAMYAVTLVVAQGGR
ncbi:MAG TPA: hypothetical protein VKS82_24360 [Streptosporangiaceae bacterium]|nr:hypothetical protein [Streptosporangiaceae bacterium]